MFGRGKIDVSPQKTSYVPGKTISGNVALTPKKPVKAKGLSISLIGEGKTRVTTPGVGMAQIMSTTVTCSMRICDFEQPLDGEKEYHEGQEYYFFEMKIPADILNMRRQVTGRVKWYLLAKLDIPGGLDIKKKVDITIG